MFLFFSANKYIIVPNEARKKFNIIVERTVRELNGESCLAIEEIAEPKKQILCSRSFGEKVTSFQIMQEAVCKYTAKAAEKLRKENKYCKLITVFIKTSPFIPNSPYYSNYSSEPVIATNDTRELLNAAQKILKKIWRDNKEYQKAGVILNDFYDKKIEQFDFFLDHKTKLKNEKLNSVIRHATKKRKVFSSDESAKKMIYLAVENAAQKWTMPIKNWRIAMNWFMIHFDNRVTDYL